MKAAWLFDSFQFRDKKTIRDLLGGREPELRYTASRIISMRMIRSPFRQVARAQYSTTIDTLSLLQFLDMYRWDSLAPWPRQGRLVERSQPVPLPSLSLCEDGRRLIIVW